MSKTTTEWEQEVAAAFTWEHREAIAEVVRLRTGIKDVAEFIAKYPLHQILVGSPTNDQRARDMQAKAVAALTRILDQEENNV